MYQGVCMSFGRGDIERASKQLANMDRAIQRALPKAAAAGAGELKAEAIRRAPVRPGSGALKRGVSDKPGTAQDKTELNSAVHMVYNRMFYAAPVERGRYKRPFMRPAIRAASRKITQAMKAEVMRETKRVL